MIWWILGIVAFPLVPVVVYDWESGFALSRTPYAMAGFTSGLTLAFLGTGFELAVLIVGMLALCVLLAWLEHKVRLGEAIERALTEESERVAMVQRRRFVTYLRDQSAKAESLSKCALFGSRGRAEEAYASAVLAELADQVSDGAADVVEVQS